MPHSPALPAWKIPCVRISRSSDPGECLRHLRRWTATGFWKTRAGGGFAATDGLGAVAIRRAAASAHGGFRERDHGGRIAQDRPSRVSGPAQVRRPLIARYPQLRSGRHQLRTRTEFLADLNFSGLRFDQFSETFWPIPSERFKKRTLAVRNQRQEAVQRSEPRRCKLIPVGNRADDPF